MIMLNQMRWAGHIVRMGDDRLPKQLFYGELLAGKRPQHKPRKRFKDCVKNNLKVMQLGVGDWEEKTLSRVEWRHSIRDGCRTFEDERLKHAQLKRDARKGGSTVSESDNLPSWKCGVCQRVLLSKAGYVNHIKSHDNNSKQSSYTSLPARPPNNTCVICNKSCKSTSGLKRHMAIHKKELKHPDPINPIKTTEFICHICLAPMKSNAGLKSHLRAHGRLEKRREEEEEKETAII